TPPPPQSAIVAPRAAPAPVAGPVSAGDLSSTMIDFKPPSYPVESRRKKEQGIVILTLLLGLDGAVSEIVVQKSSGFARLDEAALRAVRRWRWSPTMRGGQPMLVRGVVEIPFIIKN
ncbi:MAG: energy transducer TonB, partial [Sphingomonadaceae bacterium]